MGFQVSWRFSMRDVLSRSRPKTTITGATADLLFHRLILFVSPSRLKFVFFYANFNNLIPVNQQLSVLGKKSKWSVQRVSNRCPTDVHSPKEPGLSDVRGLTSVQQVSNRCPKSIQCKEKKMIFASIDLVRSPSNGVLPESDSITA